MPQSGNECARIFSALSFAAARHSGQRRKGGAGDPYINHLIGVADLLVNTGLITDLEVIIAGILHDTVEDTGTTTDEITERFGARVAGIVLEVTDDQSLPKDERRRRQVEHALTLSHGARLVKIADKISNIRDILESPPLGWTVADRLAYADWGTAVVDRIRGTNAPLEAAFDDLYRRVQHELGNSRNSESSIRKTGDFMASASTVPDWFYTQSSVIPYRRTEHGIDILLITTMKRKRWIVPKGVVDPGMTPRDSAAKEAWEEAGIRGRFTGDAALGSYLYRKWDGICTVQVYAFEVTEVLDDWPEANDRDRKWVSADEACELLDEPRLVEMVRKLVAEL